MIPKPKISPSEGLGARESLRVYEPRAAARPSDGDPGLPELFEQQAASRPQAPAVQDGTRRLTYGELNARANRLARLLQAEGVTPGQTVAISLERSADFVVAVLGILKAGANYLPLDPAEPAERLASMVRDTRAGVALTRASQPPALPATVRPLALESLALETGDATNLGLPISGETLAYVMFTSGSTGQPKGVEIMQRGIHKLVTETNYIQFTPADVVAFASNTVFDACTFELFGALLNGASLQVVDRETLLSPFRLAEALGSKGIKVLLLTTPLFHAIAHALPSAFGGLRCLLVGGDVLNPTAARQVLGDVSHPEQLWNVYGPTEVTSIAFGQRVEQVPADAQRIPIGLPIAHTTAHLLDEDLQPVAPGVTGELYLGGPRLARRYLASPELTAERFIETQWGRLYKTGDLGQWLPDKTLDFLGRKDQQIKHRGFRIELTEIEAALRAAVPGADVRVFARETTPGVRQLLAYLTRNGTGAPLPSATALREEMSRRVPEYMVPAAFIELANFPLNANGKLAMDSLPLAAPADHEGVAPALSPSTLHSQLSEIWEQVLERPSVGLRDDFFEIGGHSILAVRMLALVEERIGTRVGLRTLFENATIEHLAATIIADLQENSREQPYVAFHTEGPETPFFFLHGDFVGGGFFTRRLAEVAGPDRPFYAIHPHGLQGDEPPGSISVMAAERLATLREIQPHGPYLLGGYCNGGLVAFEMARLLEAEGESVPAVILFMSSGYNYRERQVQKAAGWLSDLLGDDKPAREQRFRAWRRRRLALAASLKYYVRVGRDLFHAPGEKSLGRFRRKWHALWQRPPAPPPVAPVSQEQHFWDVYHSAWEGYVPQEFSGRLFVLWPQEESGVEGERPDFGWKSVSPEVRLVYVPGNHDTSITRSANLTIVGEEIQRALRAVDSRLEPVVV